MGEETLVEIPVADAIELMKRLDSEGASPTLVAWYYYDDVGEWRLVLGGPSFDALLPTQELVAYRRVVETLARTTTSSLSATDVKLIHTRSPLSQAVHKLISTPPGAFVRMRFSNNFVNGMFIKDMVVLRSA